MPQEEHCKTCWWATCGSLHHIRSWRVLKLRESPKILQEASKGAQLSLNGNSQTSHSAAANWHVAVVQENILTYNLTVEVWIKTAYTADVLLAQCWVFVMCWRFQYNGDHAVICCNTVNMWPRADHLPDSALTCQALLCWLTLVCFDLQKTIRHAHSCHDWIKDQTTNAWWLLDKINVDNTTPAHWHLHVTW